MKVVVGRFFFLVKKTSCNVFEVIVLQDIVLLQKSTQYFLKVKGRLTTIMYNKSKQSFIMILLPAYFHLHSSLPLEIRRILRTEVEPISSLRPILLPVIAKTSLATEYFRKELQSRLPSLR